MYLCALTANEHWNEKYDAMLETPEKGNHVMETIFYDEQDLYFSSC
jgi:hypothetical protein